MPRTILVHLNLQVPDTLQIDDLAKHLADEVEGALSVGTDADQTPLLATALVSVALAEEV